MAKKSGGVDFNFGLNKKGKGKKRKKAKGTSGKPRSNAWRAYVSAPAHSSAPIPD